jgi:hypothetical protein
MTTETEIEYEDPTGPEDQEYKKGTLYQYNGTEFVELAPSGDIKVPITEAAMEAVKEIRGAAKKVIGMRPELSVVASAMLIAALDVDDILHRVKALGLEIYSRNIEE